MPASNYTILPVSSGDIPVLTNLLHACKFSLSINRLLWLDWPNEAAQRASYGGAVSGGLNDPSSTSLKPSESKPSATAALPQGKPQGPEGTNPDVIAELFRAMPAIAEDMQGIDRYEVSYICATPSNRGHGVGRALMQKCFVKAKGEGVPVFVCAEPQALDFFLKIGFRKTKHFDMDLAKIAVPYSGYGVFRLTGVIWYP